MRIDTITKRVNLMLANETLRYKDIEHILDRVMDEVNEELNSTYPVFSEFMFEEKDNYEANYHYIPDKYIRNVIIPGVAYYFYQEDEEGEAAAGSFNQSYRSAMWKFKRDFIMKVPAEYQSDKEGYVEMADDLFGGAIGIDITKGCKL